MFSKIISSFIGPLEKDIQAWRRVVTNAKIQSEYQENKLMNLEIADSYGGPVWLHSNSALEGTARQIDTMTSNMRKKCDDIHVKRRLEQENVSPSLERMNTKINEHIFKSWQIKTACEDLENKIKKLKSSNE